MRQELAKDPEYRQGFCLYHNRVHQGRPTQWHHNLIFAGRQVNERFAIMQICTEIHDKMFMKQVKERCDWIMLNRASDEELRYFSKADDLIRKRDKLNQKYGTYQAN